MEDVTGAIIGNQAQKDLDLIYEATGYRSHKIGLDCPFNAFIKTHGNSKAEEVERLMRKYASLGYVFTDSSALVLGNVCSITTRSDRVAIRRSSIKLVPRE